MATPRPFPVWIVVLAVCAANASGCYPHRLQNLSVDRNWRTRQRILRIGKDLVEHVARITGQRRAVRFLPVSDPPWGLSASHEDVVLVAADAAETLSMPLLAFVIARELAHLERGHPKVPAMWATGLNLVSPQDAMNGKLETSGLRYTDGDETDADRFALTILRAGGYDVATVTAELARIAQPDPRGRFADELFRRLDRFNIASRHAAIGAYATGLSPRQGPSGRMFARDVP